MTVKLADFSCAHRVSPWPRSARHELGHFWYTAPEVLLGEESPGFPLDVWALGCTLAELATGQPLFRSNNYSQIGTLFKIFQMVGTPTETSYPEMTKLRLFSKNFPLFKGGGLSQIQAQGRGLGHAGAELLNSCLHCSPVWRPSSKICTRHHFLQCQ